MRNYVVQGIIIHRFNIGEADRIIYILTKEQGLIQVKAISVRKIKGKLKGALELFMYSRIELAKGRSMDVVTGAQSIESFEEFRGNLLDTSAAFYLAEAVIGLVAEHEPNPAVFDLLLQTIEELNIKNTKDRKRDILISHFIIKMLDMTGFKPELFNCLNCQNKITSQGNVFSIAKGGVVCDNCLEKVEQGLPVSDQIIKIMRLLLSDGVKISCKIKANQEDIRQTRELLHNFLEYVMEREVKSNRFLKEIKQQA